jgi:hypothetical protein
VLLTVFSFFARGSIQGASAATWVAIPELYPTNLRATGHSIATIVARIGAFASPYIVNSSVSISMLGLLFAVVNLISCLAVMLLPETAGTSLDEDLGEPSMYSASALSFYMRHSSMDLSSNSIGGGGGGGGTTFNPITNDDIGASNDDGATSSGGSNLPRQYSSSSKGGQMSPTQVPTEEEEEGHDEAGDSIGCAEKKRHSKSHRVQFVG